MRSDPSHEVIRVAVAAATNSRRTNYTAAARSLAIPRARLLQLLGVSETRGGPVPHTVEEMREAVEAHGSRRAAARALGISDSTIREAIGPLPKKRGDSQLRSARKASPKSWVQIYTLTDPRTSEIRYVGQTCAPRSRIKWHMRQQATKEMAEWIGGLAAAGLQPVLSVIGRTRLENAPRVEGDEIRRHLRLGCKLLNSLNEK